MGHVAVEVEGHVVALAEVALQVDGRDDDNDVLALGRQVQVHARAHHFADVNLGLDAILADVGVLGTDTEGDRLALHVVLQQARFLVGGELDLIAAELDEELVALAGQLGVEEVHLRHADEAGDEQVGGMVENLLRGADLLDVTVAHDDDTVAQRHGLGLVVGDVDESGVDALAQLDDLRAHLVAELGVEVGQGLVHQHDLRVTHDRAANGDTLALAAGERLGLAVEILGDVQNLGSLADLLVDLVLGGVTQLQREGHVIINGHMGVQRVVLENHGDIAVLGGDIVDELAVDVQLAAGNLFKAGDHAQCGGFAAAGGADQNDEFLVGNVQVERLNGHNALIGDLEVDFLLLGFVSLFLFLLALAADEGVHLFNVFQLNSCHTTGSVRLASARDGLTAACCAPHLRQVSTLPHPEPGA